MAPPRLPIYKQFNPNKIMANIRRKLDFTPESCGTCKGCYYDIDKRVCICRKHNGEIIGQNQYTYVCDEWEC